MQKIEIDSIPFLPVPLLYKLRTFQILKENIKC